MFIASGPELGFLYNDAYVRILGDKHPYALGKRMQGIWADVWPDVSSLVDNAVAGHSQYFEDLALATTHWVFADLNEQYAMTLNNSALTYRAGAAQASPTVTVRLSKSVLNPVFTGRESCLTRSPRAISR